MSLIHPFQNESESISLGNLTIENRTDRVTIYGDIDVTRDKAGLADALRMKSVIDRIVQVLEGEPNLPERIESPRETRPIKNPFA